ncbi:hypothetical protein IGI37_000740 [Enterococcus sp. AZ194]|uniref:hypothetical protein n=1 Tax=Enterococcus sp. AZ194 TaxID=2774629 RepID=UPI003F23E041
MKKIICLFALVTIGLSLTACGNDKNPDSESQEKTNFDPSKLGDGEEKINENGEAVTEYKTEDGGVIQGNNSPDEEE